MRQVAIQLPDDLDQFVQETVASGAYQNTDEFFVSVLANFRENVESKLSASEEQTLAALRSDINLGVDQLDSGRSVKNLNWDAFIAERHLDWNSRQSAP